MADIAPLPYNDPTVRMVVHEMKYWNSRRAAMLLGTVLGWHLAEVLADARMHGQFTHALLLPIPLHPKRLRERGFNQSERLAAALLQTLEDQHLTLATNIVHRHIHTPHQTRQKNRRTRIANIQNAFKVQNEAAVHNLDIILVDDVVTTGATFEAAQRTLRAAGARHILCAAAAH